MKIEKTMATIDQGLAKMMEVARMYHGGDMARARRETRAAAINLALETFDAGVDAGVATHIGDETICAEKRAEIEALKIEAKVQA